MKKILNKIKSFLNQLFTPVNLSKVIIIFIVGIISRYLVNTYFDINVFKDYLTLISLIYYSIFACFIAFIHELFSYFNISIIPNFLIELSLYLSNIIKELFIWIISKIIDKKLYISNLFSTSSSRNKGSNSSKSHGRSSSDKNTYDHSRSHKGKGLSKSRNQCSSRDHHKSRSSISKSSAKTKDYYLENRLPIIPQGHPLGDSYTRIPSQAQEYYDYMYNPHPYNTGNVNMNDNNWFVPQNDYRYSSSDYSVNSIPYATTSYDNVAYSQNINGYNESSFDMSEVAKYFHVEYLEENGIIKKVHTPINALSPSNLTDTNYSLPNTSMFNGNNETNANLSSDVTMVNSDTNINSLYVGRGSTIIDPDINRLQVRSKAFNAIVQPPIYREVVIPSFDNKEASFSLGLKYLFKSSDSNIQSLYLKWHDITKRKFYWQIWEKGRDKYDTYEEFKRNFDPNTKIFKQIAKETKRDISKEVRELLNTDPFSTKSKSIASPNIPKIYSGTTEGYHNIISHPKVSRRRH
uniref:Uncharacterized protein n=1 Tax=Clonostachys rogersoniana TaxID=122658 RepID=A0A8F2BRE5_CLORO|nr:hypothetical protein [Clonostachys rogersoniana]